jgi:uncharacterized membrane protein YcaP (DUF421 family)
LPFYFSFVFTQLSGRHHLSSAGPNGFFAALAAGGMTKRAIFSKAIKLRKSTSLIALLKTKEKYYQRTIASYEAPPIILTP